MCSINLCMIRILGRRGSKCNDNDVVLFEYYVVLLIRFKLC